MLLGVLGDMIASWFAKIIEFISGLFAFIPMTIYFIYTSCCSLLDMFQYLIRKLAGLDVYYIDGKAQQGDLLVSFIRGIVGIDDGGAAYSTLSTVFWSLIIFSVILLVLTTIIAIIKAHYNYDAKKSQPMAIITNSIKALFTMVLVPIVTIFGLYLSEIVLKYLDTLTSASSGSNITALYGNDVNRLENFGPIQTDSNGRPIKDENGNEIPSGTQIYASYDCFGFGGPTSTTTFSGAMFKVAAYDCNRVRTGSYAPKTSPSGSRWQDFGLFYDSSGNREVIGDKIDEAFAGRLTLKDPGSAFVDGADSWIVSSSFLTGPGAAWALGLIRVTSFSKYNVGLVYYYYNLWTFNYFLAFAGIAACFTLMINIIFGLITRLIQCLALFLIYSPLIGIIPLDGGNGYKSWKKSFIENILMAYGAVIGMNLFFLILPFFYEISFFNNIVLDRIMSMLFIIAGLSLIKKFMKLLSGFIGAADANDTGKDVAEGFKSTGAKAAGMGMAAAGVGVGIGKAGAAVANATVGKGVRSIGNKIKANKIAADKKARTVHSSRMKDPDDKRYQNKQKRYNKIRDRLGLAEGDYVGRDEIAQAKLKKNKLASKIRNAGFIDKAMIDDVVKNGSYQDMVALAQLSNEERENRRDSGADVGKAIKLKEDRVPKEHPNLQAFGKGMLDVTGATFKLAGDVMGISSLFKSLGDAGAIDKAKQAIVSFGQAAHLFKKDVDGKDKIPDSLKTKKQTEDEQKAAQKLQFKYNEDTSATASKTLSAIEELNKTLEKMNNKK